MRTVDEPGREEIVAVSKDLHDIVISWSVNVEAVSCALESRQRFTFLLATVERWNVCKRSYVEGPMSRAALIDLRTESKCIKR